MLLPDNLYDSSILKQVMYKFYVDITTGACQVCPFHFFKRTFHYFNDYENKEFICLVCQGGF